MVKLILIGRLTRDVDLKTTPNGVQVASFTVAVDRKHASKDAEKKTDFYNCVVWRQLGEVCAKFLSKGKLVYIEGELQPRQYTAKDGSTKMSLDVQVESVEFLSPKSESNEEQSGADAATDMAGFTDIQSDDIPF